MPPRCWIGGVVIACLAAPRGLQAQEVDRPRMLSATQTGCDASRPASTERVYQANWWTVPPGPTQCEGARVPYRMREVLTGRTTFRFVVDSSGWVAPAEQAIALVEESSAEWTDAVLPEIRRARYEPARKGRKAAPPAGLPGSHLSQ